jgi:hypothetical protein
VINGGVEMGVGSNSICKEYIKIKENSLIKAGGLVK